MVGLHHGLASLSGMLKKGGYDVKLFDTAFYDLDKTQEWNDLRAERLASKRIANEYEHWQIKKSDMEQDLINCINEFKPKVVGITMTELTYELSLMLTRIVKQNFKDIIIVAGGVFPTLWPDTVIKENSIDVVCWGEGETALLELCDRVYRNERIDNIEGLLVKEGETVHKNRPAKLHDLNDLPHPDFSIFDEGLFYRPMQGKLYKMISVESSRGCPYNCAYCSSSKLKDFFSDSGSGGYYRNQKMEKVIDQIRYQVEKHSPEFVYFSSETFLAMPQKDFDMFIKEYGKIKIPFWFQTRFETITEERIKALKEVGMFWLTLGVEHGNEEFRKNILQRTCTNESIIKGITILQKCGIGASLNNMMGLPGENRELVFETIKLNKKLFEINDKLEFNIFMYVPYKGTGLYDMAKNKGLLPDRPYTAGSSLLSDSTLNFPHAFKEELKGLMKTFNLYIKLPEQYWPQIKIAEKSDEEGEAMFKSLSQPLQR